jgi:GH24 family phage-related lysozyme (muramidase)
MPEPDRPPQQEPQQPQKIGKKTTAGLLIAAACAVCAPLLTQPNEGLKPKPYWDPAHIRTYCYGETENVVERLYSNDECGRLLRRRMEQDYAPKVLKCLPQLATPERKHEFAALIDASYNAGWAGVCRSPMALRIKANDWTGAANTFPGWYVSAKNRRTGVRTVYPGLVRRRKEERCVFMVPENLDPGPICFPRKRR